MPEDKVKIGEHEIDKETYQAIRGIERKNIWKDLEKELETKFNTKFENLKENANVKDKLSVISEQMQSLTSQLDTLKNPPPEEPPQLTQLDVEKQLAAEKEKLQTQMSEHENKLFKGKIINTIEAKLISKGLKDEYSHLIPGIIDNHYQIENDNNKPLFRDKNDDNNIINSNTNEIAEIIIKKYPDLIATVKKPWSENINGKQVLPETASNRDLMRAGVAELMAGK